MTRHRARSFLVALLGIATLVGLAASPSANAASTRPTTYVFTEVSSTPSAPGMHKITPHERQMISKIQAGAAVSPAVDTPSGYLLVGNNVISPFLYQSGTIYLKDNHCSLSGCEVCYQVSTNIRENVTGGRSKNWVITPNANTFSTGCGVTYVRASRYYCGVNITGGTDHICGNGASPSDVPLSFNTGNTKTFEQVSGNIVFPMVSISAIFSDGAASTYKFRGWDVKNTATTTQLNSTSGTGQ